MRIALTLALLAALSSQAVAQPSAADTTATPKHSNKSPAISVAIPLAVIVASVATLAIVDAQEFDATGTAKTVWRGVGWAALGAFVAAPSLGGVYVGDWWNRGTRTRAIGAGIFALGGLITLADGTSSSFNVSAIDLLGGAVGLAGLVTYAVGAVIEIVKAPITASR